MKTISMLGGCALLTTVLLSSCAYDPYVYGGAPPRAYSGYGYGPSYGYAPYYGYGPRYSSLSFSWFNGGWWGRNRYDHHHHHHHAAAPRTVTGHRTVYAGNYQRDPRPLTPIASGSRHSVVTPRPQPPSGPGTFDRGSPSSMRAGASLPSARSAPPSAPRMQESRPPTLSPSRPSPSFDRGSSRSRSSELRASTGGHGSSMTSSRSHGSSMTSSRGSGGSARFSRERR